MRELTKSMLRFSWAMPLFGIRQLTQLSLPTESNLADAKQAFNSVTSAAQSELGSAFQGLYEAGDRLQSGLVDAMLGGLSGDALNPMSWIPGGSSQPPKAGGGQSTAAGTSGTGASAAGASPQGGWGPIPGG